MGLKPCGQLTGPLMSYLCLKFGRPAVTTLGFSLIWLSMQLIGPTRWLYLPHSLTLVLVGMFILGMGGSAI